MTAPAIDLTDRSCFTFWCSDSLRFSDLDMNGHVNNLAFMDFSQSGRISMLHGLRSPDMANGRSWVVAKHEMDYLAEVHFPGTVEIGNCIVRIGNSSCVIGQGLFNEGRAVATCKTVMVRRMKGQGSVALEPELRARLEALMPGH